LENQFFLEKLSKKVNQTILFGMHITKRARRLPGSNLIAFYTALRLKLILDIYFSDTNSGGA